MVDTGADWKDQKVEVAEKVDSMIIKENQKGVNIKKFKKQQKKKLKPIWKVKKAAKRSLSEIDETGSEKAGPTMPSTAEREAS